MTAHNRRSLVNGIRTQKTVNGTVTNYNYHGSALISQVTGNDTLLFSYDAAGNVVAVNYNGTYYYYVRNGQNDVIRLIDGENNTVVEYAYGSWGRQICCACSRANTLGTQKEGMRKAFKAPGRRGAGRPEGIDIAKDGRDLPAEAVCPESSTDSITDKISVFK